MKRWLYNNLVPRFLKHFRQKYICGWLGWHKEVEGFGTEFISYTCRECGHTISLTSNEIVEFYKKREDLT